MRLFRRGPRRDSRETPRDQAFSFFSIDEAAYFRAQVREAFAEQGLEVTLYEAAVVDNAGRQFGLGNLAAVCHNDDRGPRAWGELARRHAAMVLRTVDGPSALDTLAPAQIKAQLYPRVISGEGLDAENFGYARSVAPGLYELLALDLPESVMMLTDEALGRLGETDRLRERALANLRELPVEARETVKDEEGMRFEVVVGDSFYTASRVLALETLVRQTTGQRLTEDGALVAMPFRHQLAFHVIRDAGVLPSLTGMAAFAASGYEDTPGAISPYVYWWRGGTIRQLSERDEDGGGLRVVVDGEFQEVLERLVTQGPA
ncbi:DUF1444 domain-containing protein [Streptomyces fuscigenes]|uniref:DUF1444 domain-containing protein n=1 Tax=Streptomyces fuscigenes TaxID=1528880 RepID=UPI001F441684|nr:DUF1444 domain-containing protein [Streptomyces fuscigenes]MCF3963484.1 DUF1444 domain-containing protein [Streptomyces fuscigenes]